MKIDVYPWYDKERNAVCLRWGIYEAGLIADCARWVSPGRRPSDVRTKNCGRVKASRRILANPKHY